MRNYHLRLTQILLCVSVRLAGCVYLEGQRIYSLYVVNIANRLIALLWAFGFWRWLSCDSGKGHWPEACDVSYSICVSADQIKLSKLSADPVTRIVLNVSHPPHQRPHRRTFLTALCLASCQCNRFVPSLSKFESEMWTFHTRFASDCEQNGNMGLHFLLRAKYRPLDSLGPFYFRYCQIPLVWWRNHNITPSDVIWMKLPVTRTSFYPLNFCAVAK